MGRRILIEIAVDSGADAIAACRAGADRLELCAALDVGGLTPMMETLAEVKQAVSVPVMVMICPRAGEFCYSDAEIAAMQDAIAVAVQHGADGLVFGALTADRSIHIEHCRSLLAGCHGHAVVFHRAFDETPDAAAALEQLIELGFTRVLTAGHSAGAATAEGAANIARLIEQARGRIEILPGGGVRPENVASLIRLEGCSQIHSSCRAARSLNSIFVLAIREQCDSAGGECRRF